MPRMPRLLRANGLSVYNNIRIDEDLRVTFHVVFRKAMKFDCSEKSGKRHLLFNFKWLTPKQDNVVIQPDFAYLVKDVRLEGH